MLGQDGVHRIVRVDGVTIIPRVEAVEVRTSLPDEITSKARADDFIQPDLVCPGLVDGRAKLLENDWLVCLLLACCMIGDPLLAPCGDIGLLTPVLRVCVHSAEVESGNAQVEVEVDTFSTLVGVVGSARLVIKPFVTECDKVVRVYG